MSTEETTSTSIKSTIKNVFSKLGRNKEKVIKLDPTMNLNGSIEIDGDFTILNDYFRIHTATYKLLKRNIDKKINTMCLGPTGQGKTELVANLASAAKLPLTIFDMGTMTDPIMSLVGTHTIKVNDGHSSSRFVTSRFSQVIQRPGVVLLDEISRASAQANNLLFPCLDFRKELAMEYAFDGTEPIKVHPDCIFFATANVGSQYTGTHKMDRALIDRFLLIEIDALDRAQLIKVVSKHCPSVEVKDIETMVTSYLAINTAHDEYKIGFNLSLRHLKLIAELMRDTFTIYDSFYAICKGLGSKEGLNAIKEIMDAASGIKAPKSDTK